MIHELYDFPAFWYVVFILRLDETNHDLVVLLSYSN
jgi:hypothetical protein